jgi:hypothetical protein
MSKPEYTTIKGKKVKVLPKGVQGRPLDTTKDKPNRAKKPDKEDQYE